jgi:serine protease AprX
MDYANPGVYADYAFNYGWKGAGIGVAIVDSGVYDHPDLKNSACLQSRIVYKANFVTTDNLTTDGYGHGTHIAGIIGGNSACAESGMTRSFRGIAPEVNLISLRALDNNGSGTDAAVISAIDAAIALKNTYNIRVINLSLGRPVRESYTLDPLCQAVERAWQAGIVVVTSAGNRGRTTAAAGYGTISSPGNDPYVSRLER